MVGRPQLDPVDLAVLGRGHPFVRCRRQGRGGRADDGREAPPLRPAQPQPKPQPVQPKADAPKPSLKPAIPLPGKPTEAPTGPIARTSDSTSVGPTMIASTNPMASGASAAGIGHTNSGNPEPGDGSTPGVNVEQDIDFGPFMADLERRIKRNWEPPRAKDSKRVKVRFFLKRDGQVVDMELLESSGEPDSDKAALQAIRMAAPFRPFPAAVRDDILPIEFTFDYNVFNPAGRQKARS